MGNNIKWNLQRQSQIQRRAVIRCVEASVYKKCSLCSIYIYSWTLKYVTYMHFWKLLFSLPPREYLNIQMAQWKYKQGSQNRQTECSTMRVGSIIPKEILSSGLLMR